MSDENVQSVLTIVSNDNKLIWQNDRSHRISIESAKNILKDRLKINELPSGWMPKLLRENQTLLHPEYAVQFLNKFDSDKTFFYQNCY